MTEPTLVFDIETIPDIAGARRILEMPDAPDDEVWMALRAQRWARRGNDFMPAHLQKIVAISCVLRTATDLRVWSLGDESAGEAELVQRFFDGIDLRTIDEGSVVTQWQQQPVRTLSVPGHYDGQVALMPDGRSWCIVGDLIQGVGTVVISKPEGDMRRYFESLERIIELAPRFIFPSHGIGMGTTLRLEETLKHRRQREAQVLQLQREGRSMQQMLDAIYAGLDPRLAPLAIRNIESHLDKLRADGELPQG